MLKSPVDEPQSDAEWQSLLLTQSFGQLIVPGLDDDPPIVVPAHFWYDGARTLGLHLHRDNPVWEAIARSAVSTFAILDACVYIPTQWNGDPGPVAAWSVPTSYYAAVQVVGPVRVLEEPEELAQLLNRQMERMQPEGGYPRIEPGGTPFGRILSAIRGLNLTIAEVHAKFKFGGNKGASQRLRISELLAGRGHDADIRARGHLLRRLGQEEHIG